jgi:hypothetical protein
MKRRIIWSGQVRSKDDFGDEIADEFIDGKTQMGPWAIMTPASWRAYGVGSLGTGYGQRYARDGNVWKKVEG